MDWFVTGLANIISSFSLVLNIKGKLLELLANIDRFCFFPYGPIRNNMRFECTNIFSMPA